MNLWYVVAAVTVVAVAEALVIVRLSRTLAVAARFGERIGHLTSALELLTDTTEAGMTSVAAELERSAPTRAARSTRGATSRRISTAVKKGRTVADIAASEALSESEVRLHMHLAPSPGAEKVSHGAVR